MSANFDPTMGNFKNMSPFKMWCQKVLPLTYDDSLSYYEVLCKLKNFLNEVIENMDVLHDDVDALHGAYQQLEAYVNSYFDNLSVQTEINNKLDAMALDGSLSALIEPFITEKLPNEVAEQIGSVVGDQIGSTVAGQIGDVVGAQLPAEVSEQVPSMVTSWLNDHVNPESEVVIDDSLTIQGAAADAKAAGDAIGELKSALTYNNELNGSEGTYRTEYSFTLDNLHQGALSATGIYAGSTTRVRSDCFYIRKGETITFDGSNNIGASVNIFDGYVDGSTERTRIANQTVSYNDFSYTSTVSGYTVLIFLKNPNTDTITPTEVKNNCTITLPITKDTYAKTHIDNLELITDVIKMSPYDVVAGALYSDGHTAVIGTVKIAKFLRPSDATKIVLNGTANFEIATIPFSVLWQVKNGQMIANKHIDIETKPQTWTNYEITLDDECEEIWMYSNMTLSSNSKEYIAERVARNEYAIKTIGDPWERLFGGAFTWAERASGMRILADANGFYYLPFNALGMGIRRGNGLDGNDYVADQIHPTDLGGYNLAMGVWSYLKNIPTWHTSIPLSDETLDGTQWNGKSWYAYGTSLSSQGLGKWCNKVASLSGMTVTNKAIGGGALVTNRQIFNALCDLTDGKLNADLITIEVGANDRGALGVPWSKDTNDFFGALNHCLKVMLDGGVQAQIVLMCSFPARYALNDPDTKYDIDRMYNNN